MASKVEQIRRTSQPATKIPGNNGAPITALNRPPRLQILDDLGAFPIAVPVAVVAGVLRGNGVQRGECWVSTRTINVLRNSLMTSIFSTPQACNVRVTGS